MADPITFIEWDDKHRQYLIRLAGNVKSQEARLAKMKASEEMYEALKRVAKLLQAQQDILFGTKWEKDFEELAFVKEALAKAGGE